MKAGVLASGNLGLMCLREKFSEINPIFIATDKGSDAIIKFANDHEIPIFIGNPRNQKLTTFLKEKKINTDIIFSINYLFIVEKDLIESVQYLINFHGSLLPKYRGRTPHVWSIINNENTAGVTAHLVDEGCDTGPVILQKEVAISINDTGASLLEKYNAIYPIMISEIIQKIHSQNLDVKVQNHALATFFGKRTPEDGKINWDWQKERIRNWIRAQAYPYPGAFTFYGEEKIIIDEIKFSDMGFHANQKNGTILKTNPIHIKTSNGVIEILKWRSNELKLEIDKNLE